jgi:hypothetical protein
MWLPLPTAQGYKAQALKGFEQNFFQYLLFFLIQLFSTKNFCPKSLTALPTPQQQWLSFFSFQKN